jgi:arabinose-5-phosphate isomerase
MVPENSIVFCLSKSGNSEEIQFLVNLLKLRGVYIIGVCANTESHLAKNASLLLFTPMEKEACPNNLAPTVSTTLQLAVGDSLAVALMHARNFTSSEFAKHHPGGALGKYLFTRVKDILRPNSLAQVNLESSLQEVLMEISSKRMGATTVFNNSQLCGFITDGDIRRYFEKNKISESTEIKALHLMSTKPLSIETNALAVEAFRLMEEKKINQLLVCENLIPVGIIHIHDIIATGIR